MRRETDTLVQLPARGTSFLVPWAETALVGVVAGAPEALGKHISMLDIDASARRMVNGEQDRGNRISGQH